MHFHVLSNILLYVSVRYEIFSIYFVIIDYGNKNQKTWQQFDFCDYNLKFKNG